MEVESTLQPRPPSPKLAAKGLVVGRRYMVRGYATEQTGEFRGWVQDRCQGSGDFIGWRAAFQGVKASGKWGNRFSVDADAAIFSDA